MYYPAKIKPGTVIDEVLGCVDFLPTVLGLMDVEIPEGKDGRDASLLFTAKTPSGWKDITFMRIDKSWLCAVTGRYKIIYARQGVPWLFDLKMDPDELTNFYADPQYKSVVKKLSGELMTYCKRYNEPHFANPKIKAEMEKAVES
jgi:uncharacterized sulfatase